MRDLRIEKLVISAFGYPLVNRLALTTDPPPLRVNRYIRRRVW
jgi:hypothetical protein